MTKYEIRVKSSQINYYRLEAKDENDAKEKIKHALSTRIMDDVTLDDTIKRQHVIEYAVELTSEGEPIL